MTTRVVTGLERLVADPTSLRGRRIGLLCNPTSVDAGLRHAADLIAGLPGVHLVRLFGPEHGIRGEAQDMIPVTDHRDPRTGLPVVSLYGSSEESLRPGPEQIRDLDLLVCDLQDIGSRYYTYGWTVLHCLEACAACSIPVLVCDRPNPLGGDAVEGGLVRPGFESFVGRHPIPNRHGLTLGELAYLLNQERKLGAALTVVEMTGWQRGQWFDSCGLPWVMPSPNMPTLDTALVYPGLCLVEGTDLSEGRGTTRPFELIGAPGVNPDALRDALDRLVLPGVAFRPVFFQPQFQKHAHVRCGGVQLHVTDRHAFRPYLTGVALVATLRLLHPEVFAWRTRAYEFVENVCAFDLLTGSDALRLLIDREAPLVELQETWQADEADFRARREAYLRY